MAKQSVTRADSGTPANKKERKTEKAIWSAMDEQILVDTLPPIWTLEIALKLVAKFKIYNQLKYKSGWGWNSDCYHPVVHDSVWEEYIEKNPKNKKFRDPWQLWPKMLEMCQDSAVTGAAAIDPGAEDSELTEGHSMMVEERDRQLADEWAAASDEEKVHLFLALLINKKRPADPNTVSAGPPKRIRMTGAMGLKPPTPATTPLQEACNLFRIQDKLFVDFSIAGVFELFREHPAIVEI
ncbi:hypothetical protein BT69DRAFT_1301751 [Atractiella rhizophila]|nr:hypothetical protein BT69DRAFT_1301751 [Atractiella rhizophila]